MKTIQRLCVTGVTIVLAACAQNSAPAAAPVATVPSASTTSDVMKDLGSDVADAQKKFMALANAMPEGTMNWRPMPGVRSVREVFLHIAGENYLAPSFMGAAIPASTGLVTTDDKTVEKYEKRDIKKVQVVSELQASFDNLNAAMHADSSLSAGSKIKFYGSDQTREHAWIGTVTHLHEHLGQAIAYARSNKVVPPWSK